MFLTTKDAEKLLTFGSATHMFWSRIKVLAAAALPPNHSTRKKTFVLKLELPFNAFSPLVSS
jgi:hypothetical protein